MTAGELYMGPALVQGSCSRGAKRCRNVGDFSWLGLLHASDPVVPYEATFSSMPFCHRTHWGTTGQHVHFGTTVYLPENADAGKA